MPKLSLCFQCHQPYRLNHYSFFQIGSSDAYFDTTLNQKILNEMAERCYLPANQMMQRLILSSGKNVKIALALSVPFLDQLKEFRPDILESFKELVSTGCVELLAQTSHQSLASLFSPEEFIDQIQIHRDCIKELFNVSPKVLWNTEMLYSDAIAECASAAGVEGILADGIEYIRNGRSPNELYFPQGSPEMLTILRHHNLSEDFISNRKNSAWSEYPLSGKTFQNWIGQQSGHYVNISSNYEIFDLLLDPNSFTFFEELIDNCLEFNQEFITPSDLLSFPAKGPMPCRHAICSKGDGETDLMLGNVLQQEASRKIFQMTTQMHHCNDPKLVTDWRNLQSVDHFYYMNFSSNECYQPYPSAYEAYNFYTNVLADAQIRLTKDIELLGANINTRIV